MSFNIDKGLFSSDFIDHHAVLGIPVDSDAKAIRKRFLKIARRLHPDSSDLKTDSDRQLASSLLSKLVNPAYEYLSQDKNFTEHQIILKLKGQQAQRQQDTVVLSTEIARKLASSPNASQAYQAALNDLIEGQYETLEKTIEVIGSISELNLVYLMRTADQDGAPARSAKSSAAPPSSSPGQPARPAPRPASAPPKKESLVDSSVRRAEEFEKKQDYAKAILELREALKMNPKNSNCHSRLGMIYIKTKQPKMARIHFDKALDINPNDEIAKAGRKRLEQTGAVKPSSTGRASKSSQSKDKSNGKSGGLFGLFGGKKK
jgi:curved DNA-binding protein CbpA